MKRFSLFFYFIFSVCLFILSCSNELPLESEECDVIILAGQSNACGISYSEKLKDYISNEQYILFNNGCDNVNIVGFTDWSVFNQEADIIEYQSVKFGLGGDSSQFGLEIGISYLLNYSKKKSLIIKYTSPGNFIDFFLKDDSITTEFETVINCSLLKLQSIGYIPSIKAMCWMQGENESSYFNSAVNYETKEKKLITAIREKYGNDIVFIDARITDWPLPIYCNFQSIINNAKVNISLEDSRNYIVDSSGLTKKTDDLAHYDSRSEFLLGLRMGEIIRKIIE